MRVWTWVRNLITRWRPDSKAQGIAAQASSDREDRERERRQKEVVQRIREQRLAEKLSEIERLVRTNDPHPRH